MKIGIKELKQIIKEVISENNLGEMVHNSRTGVDWIGEMEKAVNAAPQLNNNQELKKVLLKAIDELHIGSLRGKSDKLQNWLNLLKKTLSSPNFQKNWRVYNSELTNFAAAITKFARS